MFFCTGVDRKNVLSLAQFGGSTNWSDMIFKLLF